jgi:hypothetical protein
MFGTCGVRLVKMFIPLPFFFFFFSFFVCGSFGFRKYVQAFSPPHI